MKNGTWIRKPDGKKVPGYFETDANGRRIGPAKEGVPGAPTRTTRRRPPADTED